MSVKNLSPMLCSLALVGCLETETASTRSSLEKNKSSADLKISSPEVRLSARQIEMSHADLKLVSANSQFILAKDSAKQEFTAKISQLDKVEWTKIEPLSVDGVRPERIVQSASAVDDSGAVSQWFIFDNEGLGKTRDLLIGVKDANGQVQFLEEGREWFSAKKIGDVEILWASPSVFVALDHEALNLMYRTKTSFEINRSTLGSIKRIYSVSDKHILFSTPENQVKLVEFSADDTKIQPTSLVLEITELDKIEAMVYRNLAKQIITFSEASHKVFHIATKEYLKIKKYAYFGKSKGAMTFAMDKDQMFGSLGSERYFDVLNVSGE